MRGFGWLKKIFKRSSKEETKPEEEKVVKHAISEGEKALIDWHVEYYKRKDGYLVVPGNLNVSNRAMTELPDLTRVIVEGNFSCMHNKLTSLKGAPCKFTSLISDFGVFWEGHVPENLLNPPPPSHKPSNGEFSL